MLRLLLFLIFTSTQVQAVPELQILRPAHRQVDERLLQQRFIKAYDFFAQHVGEVKEKIILNIEPPSCMRTGFNLKTGQVVFCPGARVKNAGLDSPDVFNHELFHAFFCRVHSDLCAGEREDLLEALADYFSYLLQPDENFGENFYHEHPYIRRYRTHWRPGLVQSPHEKGNAFGSLFIQEKTSFREALELFKVDAPSEVRLKVKGAPFSRLNRYRLSPGQEVSFDFAFAPEAGVAEIAWELPEGFTARRKSSTSVGITASETLKNSKTQIRFLSADGRELGRWSFYFGRSQQD